MLARIGYTTLARISSPMFTSRKDILILLSQKKQQSSDLYMESSNLKEEFEGRVALITGAAQGIGKGIALALGRSGATLALNDISVTHLQKAVQESKVLGLKCEGFAADVSDFDQVKKMVSEVVSKMAGIDILVNNAGIATSTDFLALEEKEWDHILSVNLKSAYMVSQAVIKHMLEKKKNGRIIMIGSIAGKAGGVATSLAYDVSKAGIIVMARSLARRYSKYGITVNAIAPAFVDTHMLDDLHLEDEKQDIVKLNVIQRLATPEDVANAVLFLASDRSSFITGETINVNGGRLMD